MIKSRRMRWAGRVACKMENAYNILVIEHEGKRTNLKWEHSDSSLGYNLDNQGFRVQFLMGWGGWDFSLHHHVQTIAGAHRASYPVGTGGHLPGDKAAGM
jgi:hypothetical protein